MRRRGPNRIKHRGGALLHDAYLAAVEKMHAWCETNDLNFRAALATAIEAMMTGAVPKPPKEQRARRELYDATFTELLCAGLALLVAMFCTSAQAAFDSRPGAYVTLWIRPDATFPGNADTLAAEISTAFADFNIDVTTSDPGTLERVGVVYVQQNDSGQQLGGEANWIGGIFEPAWQRSRHEAYVFWDMLANQHQDALAAIHESGHMLGLYHQSVWDGDTLKQEYNPGDSLLAPYMGLPYYAQRADWWTGWNDQHQWVDERAFLRSVTSVPEPANCVAVIGGVGLLAFAYFRRHR